MDLLSKTKGAETLAFSLSKIITALKEMVLLAEKHNIKQHLYYSDGLHRIYNLLDDKVLYVSMFYYVKRISIMKTTRSCSKGINSDS